MQNVPTWSPLKLRNVYLFPFDDIQTSTGIHKQLSLLGFKGYSLRKGVWLQALQFSKVSIQTAKVRDEDKASPWRILSRYAAWEITWCTMMPNKLSAYASNTQTSFVFPAWDTKNKTTTTTKSYLKVLFSF